MGGRSNLFFSLCVWVTEHTWANLQGPHTAGFGKRILLQIQGVSARRFGGSGNMPLLNGSRLAREHDCNMGLGKEYVLQVLAI